MAAVATPRGRPSNEELLRKPPQEILRWLQKVEAENLKLMYDHGAMMQDVNRRMQVHLMEIRQLREVNERLQRDSQELRDLCCFLDDDRQKGRKLAREWQRFGRYTASVMRQEVSAYQGKLRGLDARQQDLIRDNIQLKELCLYLDQERSQTLCTNCGGVLPEGRRDDGDGSSSSTITTQDEVPSPLPCSPPPPRPSPSLPPVPSGSIPNGTANGHVRPPSIVPNGSRLPSRSQPPMRTPAIKEAIHRHRSVINEQVLRYIRNLEKRIEILEAEKGIVKNSPHEELPHKPPQQQPSPGGPEKKFQSGIPRAPHYRKPDDTGHIVPPPTLQGTGKNTPDSTEPYVGVARPEAVVHAMKVSDCHLSLEVHEQLDKATDSELEFEELAEGEKALVREMCNEPYVGVARPEAVVHAMKVLEVHEQLDKATDSELEFEELAEGEKALVREMCNVVWRKLEDGPA
nr:coiled-coil domain-containing protein 85C-like [Rhipicephalus microplus]